MTARRRRSIWKTLVAQLLLARGWRAGEGEWVGPERRRKHKGKGNKGPRRSGGSNVYEELVNGPDMRMPDSPVGRLAEQVAVGPSGFYWNAPRSDRVW